MKPRLGTSLLLFLSAYSPLTLIVGAKDFKISTWNFEHPRAAWAGLIVGLASVVVLAVVMKKLRGQHSIQVKSITGRAGDLINYSIPYLVTFVTVEKFFELQNFIAFALFMTLLFVLTWRTQSLFLNPILAVMGYGLYEVQFQEGTSDRGGVFLIKGELGTTESVRILRLSQFLYLATKQPKKEENNDGGQPTATIGELEEAPTGAGQGNLLDH